MRNRRACQVRRAAVAEVPEAVCDCTGRCVGKCHCQRREAVGRRAAEAGGRSNRAGAEDLVGRVAARAGEHDGVSPTPETALLDVPPLLLKTTVLLSEPAEAGMKLTLTVPVWPASTLNGLP